MLPREMGSREATRGKLGVVYIWTKCSLKEEQFIVTQKGFIPSKQQGLTVRLYQRALVHAAHDSLMASLQPFFPHHDFF